jgi:hypothetical protein
VRQPLAAAAPSGIANWERVTVTNPAIPGNIYSPLASIVLTASCPAGKKVMSGGMSFAKLAAHWQTPPAQPSWGDSINAFEVAESYPTADGNGWTMRFAVDYGTTNFPAGMIEVYAICVTGS